jgi:CheY-like chemotaxis protein
MARHSPFSKPPRILHLAEDESNRNLFFAVLFWAGYEVDDVTVAGDAWQALSSGQYDLLIANNQLPDLSGFELLRKLRAAHSALPVIIATKSAAREAVSQYPLLAPSATVVEPYSDKHLLETVSSVLYFSTPGPLLNGPLLCLPPPQ